MSGSAVAFESPTERLQYIDALVGIMAKHGVTSLVEGELQIVLPPRMTEQAPPRPATLHEQVGQIMRKDSDGIDAHFMRTKLPGMNGGLG